MRVEAIHHVTINTDGALLKLEPGEIFTPLCVNLSHCIEADVRWLYDYALADLTEQIARDDTPWYDVDTASHHVRGFPCGPFLPCDGEACFSYTEWWVGYIAEVFIQAWGAGADFRHQYLYRG